VNPDFKHRIEYKEYVEATQFSARITVLSVFFSAMMIGYLFSFYYLQLVEGDHYRELAEANRVRKVSIPPSRGAILDRFGRVIARNRPAFDVMLDREKARDLDRTLATLAPVIGVDVSELRDRLDRYSNRPSHEPIPLGTDVTYSAATFIESRRADLPGVSVTMNMRRAYEEGDSGSHQLGYVGEITRSMLERPEFAEAQQGDIVGRKGVERTYNAVLQGHRGERRIVVNSNGRVMGQIGGGTSPEPGHDIRLTINLDMQRELDRAFGDQVGAGVFLDPRTGEILAMTSRPGFDPNFFSRRFNHQVWKGLVEDPRRPLLNRAVQSQYSPGSTFKPIMAMAALEEGVATPGTVFTCNGSGMFYGRRFLCHKAGGHGTINMKEAIKHSCNVYFYQLGSRLGIEAIARYAAHLGLGELTGIDIDQEKPGLVPTPEWKMKVHKDRWYPSETISVSIGQGPLMFTPLQMALVQGIIATDGIRVKPHLWRGAADEPETDSPGPAELITTRSFDVIRQAEWAVVNDGGTGTRAAIKGRDVCGKTGTAQVYRASAGVKDEDLPPEMRDHAWFVGFAPKERPRVAFAVIVEHGGHGGSAAAPIVKRVLEKMFESEERPTLPEASAHEQVAKNREEGAGLL